MGERFKCMIHQPTGRPIIKDIDDEEIVCWMEDNYSGDKVAELLNLSISIDTAKKIGEVVATNTEDDEDTVFTIYLCPESKGLFMVLGNYPASVVYSPYRENLPLRRGDFVPPEEMR